MFNIEIWAKNGIVWLAAGSFHLNGSFEPSRFDYLVVSIVDFLVFLLFLLFRSASSFASWSFLRLPPSAFVVHHRFPVGGFTPRISFTFSALLLRFYDSCGILLAFLPSLKDFFIQIWSCWWLMWS